MNEPLANFDPEKLAFAFTLTQLWETFIDQWSDEDEPMLADFMDWVALELEKVSSQLPESDEA